MITKLISHSNQSNRSGKQSDILQKLADNLQKDLKISEKVLKISCFCKYLQILTKSIKHFSTNLENASKNPVSG